MTEASPRIGTLQELSEDHPYDGVKRWRLDSHHATVTIYEFRPRARFPLHNHPQEQITLVERGEVEFTIAGTAHWLRSGNWTWVPPNIDHGLRAGPRGARVLAVVAPKREDSDFYTVVG